MTTRQELLLGYGISEYNHVIDHLLALRDSGVSVPYAVIGRVQAEQAKLVRRWLQGRGDPWSGREAVPAAIAEVQEWLAEHTAELEETLTTGE